MKEKGYDGIGFALPEGFFFVDIDHRDLTDPLLVTLLERFASCTEYSYSGDGVHIYGICDIGKIPTYIDQKGKLRLDKAFYAAAAKERRKNGTAGFLQTMPIFSGITKFLSCTALRRAFCI